MGEVVVVVVVVVVGRVVVEEGFGELAVLLWRNLPGLSGAGMETNFIS